MLSSGNVRQNVAAPEEDQNEGLALSDIVALRLVAEGPDGHVRDHAAAKIADGLVALLS